jgi:hypothetical protein
MHKWWTSYFLTNKNRRKGLNFNICDPSFKDKFHKNTKVKGQKNSINLSCDPYLENLAINTPEKSNLTLNVSPTFQ